MHIRSHAYTCQSMRCDQMKTLNIVQTQNYDLDHWKMSIDHKKASTGCCVDIVLILCWH